MYNVIKNLIFLFEITIAELNIAFIFIIIFNIEYAPISVKLFLDKVELDPFFARKIVIFFCEN